jgi:crossover junction endodeoxyribonuclease RuvC
MITIGIDPGITGAIAFFRTGYQPQVFDTPTQQTKVGRSIKQDYLPAQMAMLLEQCANELKAESPHCFIEKVAAMPGQGVTSMFNFGKGYGIWIGILGALKIPFTLVTPQAWKKPIMQGIKDKDAARIRAQQLYPDLTPQLTRKKDIGRADAILLAHFGMTTRK